MGAGLYRNQEEKVSLGARVLAPKLVYWSHKWSGYVSRLDRYWFSESKFFIYIVSNGIM